MITSIKIKEDFFESYNVSSPDGNLNSLNRINIFIGTNNSGKSRFIRKIFSNDISIQTDYYDGVQMNKEITSLINELNEFLSDKTRSTHYNYFKGLSDQLSKDLLHIKRHSKIEEVTQVISQIVNYNHNSNIISDSSGWDPRTVLTSVKNIATRYLERINKICSNFNEDSFKHEKIYIPILRGLKPVQYENGKFNLTVDNYLYRNVKDYVFKAPEKSIATGLDLYQRVTELLLGDNSDRNKIKGFEKFLSETFFNNQEVNLVPRIKQDVLYIKIGNDEFPVYDLGDGIQAIILLTYPLYFNQDEKTLFFIEEPETHLHPGLQRILIETFKSKRFKNFQYFLTTHSNHFLDLSLEFDDISIYSFHKETIDNKPSFTIKNVNSEHKQLLDLLGVRNSSVFLSNCTIWVEGITDRLYLRKYLKILGRNTGTNFKEDFHYSFIEYAGNNITHWSFLEDDDEDFPNIDIEGICSKVFLIVDNDGVELPSKRKKEKKKERQEQLKEKLGDNFYSTECLEIENLLSKEVIKKTIKKIEGNNSDLDFTAFDKKPHSMHYLGDFIEANVTGLKHKYKTEYGTIRDKVTFYKTAISCIQDENDLSGEAITLSSKLIQFIAESQL